MLEGGVVCWVGGDNVFVPLRAAQRASRPVVRLFGLAGNEYRLVIRDYYIV